MKSVDATHMFAGLKSQTHGIAGNMPQDESRTICVNTQSLSHGSHET